MTVRCFGRTTRTPASRTKLVLYPNEAISTLSLLSSARRAFRAHIPSPSVRFRSKSHGYSRLPDDAADLPAQPLIHDGPPWDQGELMSILDEGVFA
jgi:hypothetical protein